MYVRCNPNKKNIKYLSYVKGYRDVNGKARQVTVEKIGDWVDLKKIYDDPIKHFSDLAVEREKQLLLQNNIDIHIKHNQKLSENVEPLNIGYCFLKKIYDELSLKSFFKNKQNKLKINYDLNSIFQLLVFSRILFPASKNETYNSKDRFFEKFDFSLKDMYRSLDYFNQFKDDILSLVWNNTKEKYQRDASTSYYDCTNYYFEISYNDKDLIDENGNILEEGYRKKGPSKEHRPEPIIGMGLLMDKNGIPLSYDLFPGNQSEKLTLRPIVKKTKSNYDIEKTIVVADRGLNTSDNTFFLAGKNDDNHTNHDGYVYGQSIRSADAEFQIWALDQNGFVTDSWIDENNNQISFKHKSRIYAKQVTIERDGKRKNKTTIYQKQMVYYSQKYADKQKKEREIVILKAKDLINNPGKYTRATSIGAAGYVNNIDYDKETGAIIKKDLSLNLEKIKEEEKFDGYYSIVTSEKNLSDKEIRDIYKGLWKIEESFKITKSELKSRPIYVWTKEHIEAHFLTCFISLVIIRLLEQQVNRTFSNSEIIDSLKKLTCSNVHADYYIINFRSPIIKTLEPIFDLDFSDKYMDIKKIKNFFK